VRERRHNVTLPYTKNTTYSEREGIRHQCLGKDPQIPQMRDLRESYKGIFEFYLKILQNSGIMVDQRARNMALDLIVLSFNCSRPKATSPWWKIIWVSSKSR
jgi:hypothetical protein